MKSVVSFRLIILSVAMPTVEIPEEMLDAIQQLININRTSTSSVAANNTNAVDIPIPPTSVYPMFNRAPISPTSSIANHFHPVASMAPVITPPPNPSIAHETPPIPQSVDEDTDTVDQGGAFATDTMRPRSFLNPVASMPIAHNVDFVPPVDTNLDTDEDIDMGECEDFRFVPDTDDDSDMGACEDFRFVSQSVDDDSEGGECWDNAVGTKRPHGPSRNAIHSITRDERLAALPPNANPETFDMYAKCVEYSGRLARADRVLLAHKYACNIAAIDGVFAPSQAIPREATFYTYLEAVKLYDTGTTRNELLGIEWPRLVSFGKPPNIPEKTLDDIIRPQLILKIKDTAMQMWACIYRNNHPIPE
jgi:hypothetical protein